MRFLGSEVLCLNLRQRKRLVRYVNGNTIIANTASANGGGLYSVSSSAILTANMVLSNTAQWNGGGLHFEYGYPI